MVELAGGLACERECQDPPGVEGVGGCPVCDSPGQHAGFARTGTGSDAQHLGGAGHRCDLFVVQTREDLFCTHFVHGTTLATGSDVPFGWIEAMSSIVTAMGFPPDLLSDDEEIVVDMHPHWWTMVPISALLGSVIIIGLVLLARAGDSTAWTIGKGIVGLAVLATLVNFGIRYARWVTTEFVVTTERVISRSGVLSKTGIEIPLDRINTVFFNQSVFERLAGSGDLGIESAGEGGRQTFTNIRKPNKVQGEIYAQKEGFEDRRLERIGRAGAGARRSEGIPEKIAKLDELRREGLLTDSEFELKKQELLKRM